MNWILRIAAIVATTSLCAFAAEEKQATCPRQGSGGQAVTQGGGKSTVRARMSQDVALYGRDGIREIERLYRAYASKAENADEALKLLIEKYPKANRTGCAVMYAAQHSRGEERIKWLNRAIEQHSDCVYGDGAQVGAYARWFLAREHMRKGDKATAEKLYAEIRAKYPDAVTHKGQRFADFMPKPNAD